ncbi:MAG: hypothetical protein ACOX9B_15470, partial [Candidatus Xenobium sp.]
IEERSVVGNYVSTAEVRLTTQTGPPRWPNATPGGGFRVQSIAAQISADLPLGEGVGLLEDLQLEPGAVYPATGAGLNLWVWSHCAARLVLGEFLRFHVCFLSPPSIISHAPSPVLE